MSAKYEIPDGVREDLTAYAERRRPIGGFLTSVLSNDLFGAFAEADSDNRKAMFEIVRFIASELPIGCHGSRLTVDAWLRHGNKPSGMRE